LSNNVDTTASDQSIISFCTGIGGLERGIALGGCRVKPVCYVEIEAVLCENMVAAMQAGAMDAAPIWTDLKTFPARQFHGLVDGIIGGYPCQPFSLAGKRKGTDDPRHLWPFIRTYVAAIRPVWCYFENVDDHITMGFDLVYKDLSAMGYRVEAGIFSAAEVGAPHERQRLFILAVAQGERDPRRLRAISGAYARFEQPEEQHQDQGRESIDAGVPAVADIACESAGEPVDGRDSESEAGQTRGISGQRGGQVDHPDIAPAEHTVSAGRHSASGAGEPEEVEDAGSQRDGGRGDEGVDGGREVQAQGSGELADTGYIRQGESEHKSEEQQKEHTEEFSRSNKLADRERAGLQGHTGDEYGSGREGTWEGRSTGAVGLPPWPAGPGEQQYEWEYPRTKPRPIKPSVGSTTYGDENSNNLVSVNYVAYTTNKTRTIEELHRVWQAIDQKAVQGWSIGRLQCFFEEEILQSGVLQKFSPFGIHSSADGKKIFKRIQNGGMRDVRHGPLVGDTSQRQEYLEQLRGEFADAMCILSYEITLARRQERPTSDSSEGMQRLWDSLKDAWWDVPETLSAIQAAWKPVSEKNNWQEQIASAYRSYRLEFNDEFREDILRALGNAVVPAQAAKAWIELWEKFLTNEDAYNSRKR